MDTINHKAGFVAIVGNPNAGKSTLMNALMREKLSIVTHKPQTTRQSILGIDSSENHQIIYVDTPGIIKPAYRLQEHMMHQVNKFMADADIIMVLIDLKNDALNEYLKERIQKVGVPVIIAVNKIDLKSDDYQVKIAMLQDEFKNAALIPISALNNINLDRLKKHIISILPYHPKYYPDDIISEKPVRFFVEELIREKCLYYYKKELPYSIEVKVTSFKEEADIIKIHTFIYVERDSQKSIIIGNKGNSLKQVGTLAREELEKMLLKKVFLSQRVKIAPKWRKSDQELKKFGYFQT